MRVPGSSTTRVAAVRGDLDPRRHRCRWRERTRSRGETPQASARRQASTASALHAAVLRSELERHGSLPMVLAQDPDLAALLARPRRGRRRAPQSEVRDAGDRGPAPRQSTLSTRTDGRWRPATGSCRPVSSARTTASGPTISTPCATARRPSSPSGTVSGRPGLYLSRRVDSPIRPPARSHRGQGRVRHARGRMAGLRRADLCHRRGRRGADHDRARDGDSTPRAHCLRTCSDASQRRRRRARRFRLPCPSNPATARWSGFHPMCPPISTPSRPTEFPISAGS